MKKRIKKKSKYYANISKKEIVIKVINVYIVIQKIILLVNFSIYMEIVQKKIVSKIKFLNLLGIHIKKYQKKKKKDLNNKYYLKININ